MNQPQPTPVTISGTLLTMPELNEGEVYIGAFINADGTGHHTILLPGDYEPDTWQNQMTRAAADNADLPNRAELVTMYEKFPEQFQETWYWSNTTDRDGGQWAWYQNFLNGNQDTSIKDDELRARAVRRLPI